MTPTRETTAMARPEPIAARSRVTHRLERDCSGATAIEYGLIASLIAIAIIGGLGSTSGGVSGSWGNISNKATEALSRN